MQTLYKIRLMFEWGGGCIWCGNEAALKRFDVGPIEEKLSLPEIIIQELQTLSTWHDKALDWDYPPDPSPWSQEEFQEFEVAAQSMLTKLQIELGADFEVVYEPNP